VVPDTGTETREQVDELGRRFAATNLGPDDPHEAAADVESTPEPRASPHALVRFTEFGVEMNDHSRGVANSAAPDGRKVLKREQMVKDEPVALGELAPGVKVLARYPGMQPWLWEAKVVSVCHVHCTVQLLYDDGDEARVPTRCVRLRSRTCDTVAWGPGTPVVAVVSTYHHNGLNGFTRWAVATVEEGVTEAEAARGVPRACPTPSPAREDLDPVLRRMEPSEEDARAAAEVARLVGLAEASEEGSAARALVEAPPAMFLCPITHTLLTDPVVCSDGFTYEREAVVRWVQAERERGRKVTSPATNTQLASLDVVPNMVLRIAAREALEEALGRSS